MIFLQQTNVIFNSFILCLLFSVLLLKLLHQHENIMEDYDSAAFITCWHCLEFLIMNEKISECFQKM